MLRVDVFMVGAPGLVALAAAQEPGPALSYRSSYLRAELAADQPAFAALAVDSLGQGRLDVSPLRAPGAVLHSLSRYGSDGPIERT